MKKVVIFIIIAVIAIVLGIVIGVKMETGKSKETNSSDIQKKPIVNVNKENTDNNENNGNDEENKIANNEDENVEGEEDEEEPTNDLEKAIYIVKKDWGKDDTVNFDFDGTTNNGEYIIAVHEKSTTKALAWYTVNVKTGVFVKE